MDAVIVDYGLSFNEEEIEQNDLTSQGEPIGNSFTDLPERRTPDAQRHYESDLTAVCGILYHCVSLTSNCQHLTEIATPQIR